MPVPKEGQQDTRSEHQKRVDETATTIRNLLRPADAPREVIPKEHKSEEGKQAEELADTIKSLLER